MKFNDAVYVKTCVFAGLLAKLTVTFDTLATHPEQPAVVGGAGISPSKDSNASSIERISPSDPGGAATCIQKSTLPVVKALPSTRNDLFEEKIFRCIHPLVHGLE